MYINEAAYAAHTGAKHLSLYSPNTILMVWRMKMKYNILLWETEWTRKQGEPILMGTQLELKDSIEQAIKLVDDGKAVCAEVQTMETGDDIQFVYCYDGKNLDNLCFYIELCEGCVKDLKEYNPYIYENGDSVPLERIKPIEVALADCCNCEVNLGNKTGVFAMAE